VVLTVSMHHLYNVWKRSVFSILVDVYVCAGHLYLKFIFAFWRRCLTRTI